MQVKHNLYVAAAEFTVMHQLKVTECYVPFSFIKLQCFIFIAVLVRHNYNMWMVVLDSMYL